MKHNENEIPEEIRIDDEEATGSSTSSEEDVSFEEVNDEGEVDARDTVKKLREKIKKLETEKQEYLDLSQRTLADYANLKKQLSDERAHTHKFATKRFIEELLPILDAYDMAKGNKEAWESVDKNWRMGVEYIFSQLKAVLEKEGVVQHGKVGEVFDPNHHESMEIVDVTGEHEHDTIVRVLQNGYRMHDTSLRPARVHVGRYKKND